MILENIGAIEKFFSNYEWTLQSSGSNIGGFVNSLSAFDFYINFINDDYESILESMGSISSDGLSHKVSNIGAVDDMDIYWHYSKKYCPNAKSLGDVVNGTTFNDLVWKEGGQDQWERNEKGIKNLYLENGHFYHVLIENREKILINGINLSFVPLETMEKYFDFMSAFRFSGEKGLS